MGLFRHPHLIRGTVYTPKGAFVVTRGLVEAPEEIGEFYGWQQVETEDQPEMASSRTGVWHTPGIETRRDATG